MPSVSRSRRSSFLPKDHLWRKRIKRKIGSIAMIFALSGIVAYVITLPTGGDGFSLPPSTVKAALARPSSLSGTPHLTNAAKASIASAFASPGRIMGRAMPAEYNLEPGPHVVVQVSDVVLYDARRKKELHLRVIYPKDSGKYPVIIFSHDAGGSQNCCDALTRHWASYGYITLQPTHDDSALQRGNSGEGNGTTIREAVKHPELWRNRPEDILFVLDSLLELEERVPTLAGQIDVNHIGVSGHSAGSFATEAVAGALVNLPGQPEADFADPRVKATLCLSPQGPGQFGLTDHSFDQIRVPYLGVTGSRDNSGQIVNPEWHKVPFERSQPGNKYELFIRGADSLSFVASALSSVRPAQAEAILDYTNSVSLAFWDAYLKADQHAVEYLRSDALETSSAGAAKLDRR